MTTDGYDWAREEWRAARDAQSHQEHPASCACGCRWVGAEERPERKAS